MNLAISDILFATLITPKIVVSFNIVHPDGTAGSVLCKLVTGGNLAWLPGITSVVTLVAIAVERYYTALYPLDPKRKLTYRKFKVSQNIPVDLPGENTVWGLWPAVIEKESFISIFWSVRRLIFTSLDLRIRHRNLYLNNHFHVPQEISGKVNLEWVIFENKFIRRLRRELHLDPVGAKNLSLYITFMAEVAYSLSNSLTWYNTTNCHSSCHKYGHYSLRKKRGQYFLCNKHGQCFGYSITTYVIPKLEKHILIRNNEWFWT